MRAVAAIVVRAKQRADQKHRRACRAHHAREHGAEREQPRVLPRRPAQVAAHVQAARYGEQREQQDDERQVFREQRVHDLVGGDAEPEIQRERNEQRERPECGRLAEVVMPEAGRGHRHQRDRQQDAGERHDPQRRQRRAVQAAGRHLGGRRQRGEGAKEGEREARHGGPGERRTTRR